ncbi:hypothetical protein [Kaistia sp. MMO-174]|uniref:hypothetical protein n=1 Tax=Kaistia sp. MMO-174 TaxID=3081256 RepID=UPI00301B122D
MNMHLRNVTGVATMSKPGVIRRTPLESACTLSTASPFAARLEMLDRDRRRANISISEIAVAAGVSERGIRYALNGIKGIRPSTLRRLERALAELQRQARDPAPFIAATYRGLLVSLAHAARLDPDLVIGADPRHERGAIARVRMRAFYLMVTEFNLTMTAVAAIAGVTKQAISKSMREIEDERDDAAIDAMLDRVARQARGG